MDEQELLAEIERLKAKMAQHHSECCYCCAPVWLKEEE